MFDIKQQKREKQQGKIILKESELKMMLVNLAQTLITHIDRQASAKLLTFLLKKGGHKIEMKHLEAYYWLLIKFEGSQNKDNEGYKNISEMRKYIFSLPEQHKNGLVYLKLNYNQVVDVLNRLKKSKFIQDVRLKKGSKLTKKKLLKFSNFIQDYSNLPSIFNENFSNDDLMILLENYIYKGEISCLNQKRQKEIHQELTKLPLETLQDNIKTYFLKLNIPLSNLEILFNAVMMPDVIEGK